MADIKEQAALSSVFASVGLAVGKFVAAFMTGSLGLLSDALHALLDVGATILTYFAIRISGKPADDKHHYGHGKIESVTALAETALLFLLSGVVIWEGKPWKLWFINAGFYLVSLLAMGTVLAVM